MFDDKWSSPEFYQLIYLLGSERLTLKVPVKNESGSTTIALRLKRIEDEDLDGKRFGFIRIMNCNIAEKETEYSVPTWKKTF